VIYILTLFSGGRGAVDELLYSHLYIGRDFFGLFRVRGRSFNLGEWKRGRSNGVRDVRRPAAGQVCGGHRQSSERRGDADPAAAWDLYFGAGGRREQTRIGWRTHAGQHCSQVHRH
jgi:hypothetical protein